MTKDPELNDLLDRLHGAMFGDSPSVPPRTTPPPSPIPPDQGFSRIPPSDEPGLGTGGPPRDPPMEFTFGIKIVVYSKNVVYPVAIWPLNAPRPKFQKPKPTKPTKTLVSEKSETNEEY